MDNHPFLNYPHPDRDAFGGGEDIMRGLGNGHQRGLTVDVLPGNIKGMCTTMRSNRICALLEIAVDVLCCIASVSFTLT